MPGLVIAAVNPDNTPHGYNWTFAFPMLLFIVIALILYALFSRPHRRVPGRAISATASGTRPLSGSGAHGAHATASAPAQEAGAAEEPADDSDSAADDGGATGARE